VSPVNQPTVRRRLNVIRAVAIADALLLVPPASLIGEVRIRRRLP
jgi:hypothetical protein